MHYASSLRRSYCSSCAVSLCALAGEVLELAVCTTSVLSRHCSESSKRHSETAEPVQRRVVDVEGSLKRRRRSRPRHIARAAPAAATAAPRLATPTLALSKASAGVDVESASRFSRSAATSVLAGAPGAVALEDEARRPCHLYFARRSREERRVFRCSRALASPSQTAGKRDDRGCLARNV